MSAKIDWFARVGTDKFSAKKEFYAGTYTKKEPLTVELQVWNNRWGIAAVDNIDSAVINFYFDTLEDSALLKHCSLILDDREDLSIVIKNNMATAILNRSLTGAANDGDETNSVNKNNFAKLTFKFDAGDYQLKENDLKNLFFEVIDAQ